MNVDDFITRWTAREGGAERANYQMFLSELCDVLSVPRPQPAGADRAHNDYVFERAVSPRESAETTAPKRIDLYKKGAFILEAKQSRWPGGPNALPAQLALFANDLDTVAVTSPRGWDVMMQNARKQAENYVFLLDARQPAPPFIIVCDVGRCIELYADFSGTGRAYSQFPDRKGFRILMDDLRRPEVRERLAAVWTDPHALDPTKESARVTREIAKRLADVSKALEEKGANAEDVAHFLMRCLFTMFAEDTELLPAGSFATLLEKCVADPAHFPHRLKTLWSQMEKGEEFSHVIEARVRHFNGGLFKNTTVFELDRAEIGELLAAAKADWKQVDPAIFGTLLEQALSKEERKKLGAHYTPRAYVQRLVDVTVMEPLRADWQVALTKAQAAKDAGDNADAVAIVRAFRHQLCTTRVLDPACGTGNFLYVSLELMKKLEGEVLQTLADLGDTQEILALRGESVDPHQFLGLELNPRAAAIAELVIWIGYLQWHYRNYKTHPAEPILRAFQNINFGHREGYDAVLTWDGYPQTSVELSDKGRVETYPGARRPRWPEADFIVGNPPFSGVRLMRRSLGTEYVDALRSAYDEVPETSDYVVYWWHVAATLVSLGRVRRFGFISTNSISQIYSRPILRHHLRGAARPCRILYAIADHPWVDAKDGADVRVAITVVERADRSSTPAVLGRVVSEADGEAEVVLEVVSQISESLREERGIDDATELMAARGICFQGVVPAGDGFKLTAREAEYLEEDVLKPYVIGRDLTQRPEERYIIDAYGLAEVDFRARFPQAYQRLIEQVLPERRRNARKAYRENWWIFAEPRPAMRDSLSELSRFIGTPYTSKHRVFTFVPIRYIPDAMVYAVALDDGFTLAVLSSSIHLAWSVATSSRMGVGNDYRYTKSRCFDPFPFPDPSRHSRVKLVALGEELDTTRKRVQADNVDLTLTGLYNVLEKIKSGSELTEAEEDTKHRGLVLILKELHDQIDALTAEAYGWPAGLTDEQILERLVALNAERAKEETAGQVRWLRPDYQIPRFAKGAAAKTGELALAETVTAIDKGLPAFPKDRYEQPLAVEAVLIAAGRPMTVAEVARGFKRGGKGIEQKVVQALTTLTRYGRVSASADGRFSARKAA